MRKFKGLLMTLGIASVLAVGVAVGTTATYQSDIQAAHAAVGNKVTIGSQELTSIYEANFDDLTTGTAYQGDMTYNVGGLNWFLHYGVASTTDAITGTASLQIRQYSSKDSYAYIETKTPLADVKGIKFNCAGSGTNMVKLSYSTNATNWTELKSSMSTGAYEHVFPETLATFYLKAEFTSKPNSSKKTFIIDDVVFAKAADPTAPAISFTEASINTTLGSEPITLTATTANLDSATFTWKSSAPAVATVDTSNHTSSNTLTIVGPGTTTITISSGDVSATIQINVSKYAENTIGYIREHYEKDKEVTVTGTVTAIEDRNITIQQGDAGIVIRMTSASDLTTEIGHSVTATGKLGKHYGLIQVNTTANNKPVDNGVGEIITANKLSTLTNIEDFVSSLVTLDVSIKAGTISGKDGLNAECTLDGTTEKINLRFGKEFASDPLVSKLAQQVGDELYTYTGVVGYYNKPQLTFTCLEELTSAKLAALTTALKMDDADLKDNHSDTGACTDPAVWTPVSKARTALSTAEAILFENSQLYKDAHARYVAWGKRNGVTNTPLNGQLQENSTAIITIVTVSVIAITAIAAFTILAKRRKSNASK